MGATYTLLTPGRGLQLRLVGVVGSHGEAGGGDGVIKAHLALVQSILGQGLYGIQGLGLPGLAAHHGGMEVFAMSVITDLGEFGDIIKCSHEEVQKAAAEAQPRMTLIMRQLIEEIQ